MDFLANSEFNYKRKKFKPSVKIIWEYVLVKADTFNKKYGT